jgi:hypothetical protein
MRGCDIRVVLPHHVYRAPPFRGIVERWRPGSAR